ncbi:MAG: hypothetical protein IANPNBLG_01297 [Bryobacteraceae bacterium]|nr:hypothetical protein [Bryobacteraceae bacterium]
MVLTVTSDDLVHNASMFRRVLLAFLVATSIHAADPWTGVWKMDPAKSQFPGEPPKDVVLTYQPDPAGFRFTSTGKLQDGTPYSYHYTAAPGGKDYPVTGHASFDTVSIEWKAPVLVTRYKRQGKILATHESNFDSGGKVMTDRTEWKTPDGGSLLTIAHFDKQ